jgi:PAS domain S-box-containing protein
MHTREDDHGHTRPATLESDCSAPLHDQRRVLLVGAEDDWRLLTSYLFEDAGYTAYAAVQAHQAVRLLSRLLPDVVVVQMEDMVDGLDVLMRLREDASMADMPVVVLTAWIESAHAQHVRALGGVPFAPDGVAHTLVREVDTLIVATARERRALKRRLLDLQELAQHYSPDADGKAQLRRLIDQLQVAIFAVDEHGHCIAASEGLTMLTGYSRLQLLSRSVSGTSFVPGHVSDARWRRFLVNRQSPGMTTITTRAGKDVAVHAACVAEILPGVHVAAFAAADPRGPETERATRAVDTYSGEHD